MSVMNMLSDTTPVQASPAPAAATAARSPEKPAREIPTTAAAPAPAPAPAPPPPRVKDESSARRLSERDLPGTNGTTASDRSTIHEPNGDGPLSPVIDTPSYSAQARLQPRAQPSAPATATVPAHNP